MSLTLLNNISALYAENNLTSTQANLQTTLQQLSSGTRINSGADDPAGLAISDGLGANEAALTQSSQNASDGIGLLQTADGALSQVTSLLDQAVTLATEASNGTLTGAQVSSANQEYQNILSQIGNIGATTNFNSSSVFSNYATNIVVTDGTSSGLNTYADVVGSLSTASVGTTAAAAITTTQLTPGAPSVVSPSGTPQPGTYNINLGAATDTLSGTLSFSVGGGQTYSVSGLSGNLSTVLSQLTAPTSNFTEQGFTAALNNANPASATGIVITGPSKGSDAAANTVSFTGSSLIDTPAAALTGSPSAGSTAQSTTSTIAFAGGAAGVDRLSGTISYAVGNGATQTFTLAPTTTINANAASQGTGTASTDIAYQLNNDATFHSLGLTASTAAGGTALTISGPAGNTEGLQVTLGSGSTALQDVTTPNVTPATVVAGGAAGTPATYTLTTLSSTTAAVLGGSITINSADLIAAGFANGVTIQASAGATGTLLAQDISNNQTLKNAGISANMNGSGQITITGNAKTGAALTVTSALTDSGNGAVTPTAGSAASMKEVSLEAFSGAGNVLGGSITIGTTQISAAGDSGSTLAAAINTQMKTAGTGITAQFNGTTDVLSIFGNANGSSLPGITSTTLTDTGDPAYNDATITPGAAAVPLVVGSTSLSAFTHGTSTLGGSVTVNGTAYSIGTGVDGQTAASNLTTALGLAGVNATASFSTITDELTIKGAADGSTAPTINANGITDSTSANDYVGTVLTPVAPQEATRASSSIAAFSGDTAVLSGTITINGNSVNIETIPGTAVDGDTAASNISTNAAMVADHVTASYDDTTHVLTILGPADGSSTPTITANGISDSGAPYQGSQQTSTVAPPTATLALSGSGSNILSGSININGVNVTGFTDGTTLASQIDAAMKTAGLGISASFDTATDKVTITGDPANPGTALNFTGGDSIQDSGKAAITPTQGALGVAGTMTTSTLTIGGDAKVGDTLTGIITFTDSSNGVSNQFDLGAQTTKLTSGDADSLDTLLNANGAFKALGLTASVSNNVLTVTGAPGVTNTITLGAGTLSDATNNIAASVGVTKDGNAATPATETFTLGGPNDTFGGSLNITPLGSAMQNVNLNGYTGQQAAAQIMANTALVNDGVSASWNEHNNTLTITGSSSGAALNVTGVSLKDNAPATAVQATPPTGGPALGSSVTLTLLSPDDTISGTLNVNIPGNGTSLSLGITGSISGSDLASQINNSSKFEAANVSAAYNSTTGAVTITGPAITGDALTTTGSSLYDNSSAGPQAGANFTTAGVSTLTAATASQILTTVTAAVADVAYQRGTIGADVNELSSASSVASAESVNLTSAQNTVDATDYGQAASNMSKYQILSQTGISALAQANSVQQEVLKLLQ